MTRKGLADPCPGPVQQLITHKYYVVKLVDSIIKETNLDPCAKQSLEDLGASGLFELSRVCSSRLLYCVLSLCSPYNGFLFLFQVLVRMRALQDKCVVNEGEICRFCKCQEIKNKERD